MLLEYFKAKQKNWFVLRFVPNSDLYLPICREVGQDASISRNQYLMNEGKASVVRREASIEPHIENGASIWNQLTKEQRPTNNKKEILISQVKKYKAYLGINGKCTCECINLYKFRELETNITFQDRPRRLY